MAFTSPESDLDSSLDGQLINFISLKKDFLLPNTPWDQSGPLSSMAAPATNSHIFSNQDISLSTLIPNPSASHHHHHQGMLDFLIGGSHFSSERSTISDSSNKFFEGLWQKKKMVNPNPNPNPPHPPPPPRYGRFLNRWFTFFLREGLWQKHMALDSSHLNEGRGMGASKNWNIPSLGPYHWFPSLINH